MNFRARNRSASERKADATTTLIDGVNAVSNAARYPKCAGDRPGASKRSVPPVSEDLLTTPGDSRGLFKCNIDGSADTARGGRRDAAGRMPLANRRAQRSKIPAALSQPLNSFGLRPYPRRGGERLDFASGHKPHAGEDRQRHPSHRNEYCPDHHDLHRPRLPRGLLCERRL
jgi:hypothetical protein